MDPFIFRDVKKNEFISYLMASLKTDMKHFLYLCEAQIMKNASTDINAKMEVFLDETMLNVKSDMDVFLTRYGFDMPKDNEAPICLAEIRKSLKQDIINSINDIRKMSSDCKK